MSDIWIMTWLAIVVTILIAVIAVQMPMTCEEVRGEILSFEQCLSKGHACHVDGPEGFTEYREMQKYVRENCP